MSSNDPNNAAYDLPATIPSGQTTSNTVDLIRTSLCGLFMPPAFTGTSIKIYAAPRATGTFLPIQDGAGGGDLSIAVAASKYIPITSLALFAGVRFIQIVSNATEGADRSIQLATRTL